MRIRCPHCRNPIELIDDDQLRDLVCPSCGSSFNLLADETMTRQSGKGRKLGHFELVDRIGVGAFGEVWTARDSDLDRTVAVKMPRKDRLTDEEAEAFLREARSAARLNHPNIVSVHEVGKEDDQLFIVSDYVEGVTLADWLTGRQPTPREAAELCAKIAEAVQHAHDHGVIHRDLKPSNIMLDDDGQPHIMDFGLAKRDAGEITMTVEGKVLGTPAYMPPEQALGAAHGADERSDVYSLGVILFELLTGELPFRGNARMLIHQVINDEPPSPRKLNANLPRDLETICLKCLEKERRNRYESASLLGNDLDRYLAGRAIESRPTSVTVKAWRWCRKNAMLTTVVCLLFVSLTFGFMGMTWLANERTRARDIARNLAEERRRELYISDMGRAQNAAHQKNFKQIRDLLDRHEHVAGQEDLRCFEWYYLDELWDAHNDIEKIPVSSFPYSVDVSPDGTELAAGMINNSVTICGLPDSEDGVNKPTVFGPANESYCLTSVAYSPDGKYLVYSNRNVLHWRPLADGEPFTSEIHSDDISELAFSPDGKLLLSAGKDATVCLSVANSGESRRLFCHTCPIWSVAWLPDGTCFAVGDDVGNILVFDLATREVVHEWPGHGQRVESLAFSPDGQFLVSGSDDASVAVWDWRNEEKIQRLVSFADDVRSVKFFNKGKCLAVAARDGTVKLWQVESPYLLREKASIPVHSSAVVSLAVGPSEKKLVTGGCDFFIGVVDLCAQRRRDVIDCGATVKNLVFSSDGSRLFAMTQTGKCFLVDTGSGQIVNELSPLSDVPTCFAYGKISTANGPTDFLAVGQKSGCVEIWTTEEFEKVSSFAAHSGIVQCIAVSPMGDVIASGGDDSTVRVSTLEGSLRQEMRDHSSAVLALAFSPDGESIVSGGVDSSVILWQWKDVPDRRQTLYHHKMHVMSLEFSPRGKSIASTSWDYTVQVHYLDGREDPDVIFGGHRLWVSSVAFSRDGRTLFSGSGDHTIRIWDLPTRQERCAINAHPSRSVTSLALSPDETVLASGGTDGYIRLWRAEENSTAENDACLRFGDLGELVAIGKFCCCSLASLLQDQLL